MPALGKGKSTMVLADTETENGNGESKASPCEKAENKLSTEVIEPGSLQDWWNKAKNSEWVPWAVAAGFGFLWIKKGK